MNVLVTGGAGFIGSHLVDQLLAEDHRVTTLDNFDPYYDVAIKEANVSAHLKNPNFKLLRTNLLDMSELRMRLTGTYDVIVHLAARAGVRPSIEDPIGYQQVNVGGTQNLLEFAKERGIGQFVFASSSSVYGVNPEVPWREDGTVLKPISPYAATKVAGELLGHVYSHLYGIRFIALRFFTVYGPRQRPDLAIQKFSKLIRAGKPIQVFGDGSTSRDYTFVRDTVQGIRSAMDYRKSLYEVVNLGSDHPVTLSELIAELEQSQGRKAILEWQTEQPGDVPHTWADLTKARSILNYKCSVSLEEGLREFAATFLD